MRLPTFFKLSSYLRPFRGMIIASCLLAIPLSMLRLGPVVLVQRIVDELMVQKNPASLYYFPMIFIGLYLINFFIRFGHYYLMRIVVTRIDQKLKNDLFEHLLGLSPEFTEKSTGTLISRVAFDPNYVVNGVAAINSLVREPVTFLLMFGYAVYLNWKLTFITLLIFPPLAWVFSRSGKHLRRYIVGISEENTHLISALQESFSGIRVIKTFQLERYARGKFHQRTENYARLILKSAILEEASHPMVELLTAFLIAATVYYGGKLLVAGEMTPGQLTAFFGTFAMMLNPLRTLNDINIKISQASGATERLLEVFAWKSSLKEAPKPRTMPARALERELSFTQVSFAYPDTPSRMVLKDVSFTVPRGQIVALAGASGSGKSSLVSLLPRIFDVTSGRIEIDGQDIREFSVEELRRNIAVVSQDVFLFNDTIEENIRCGRLSATPEEIREAAKNAHAFEFIESMPHGFKTIIGDRGLKLSGGERQRVSIARAFLRNAPILILDEATSSLDTKSERAVQSALDELIVGKTTVIVAHRLSTIKNAHQILVMKDGQIVERGSHEDLVRMGGEYAHFHETVR